MLQKLMKLEEETLDLNNTADLFKSSTKEIFMRTKANKFNPIISKRILFQIKMKELKVKKDAFDETQKRAKELIKNLKKRKLDLFSNVNALGNLNNEISKKISELKLEIQELNFRKIKKEQEVIKLKNSKVKIITSLSSISSVYPQFTILKELNFVEKEYFQNVSVENLFMNSVMIDVNAGNIDSNPLKRVFSIKHYESLAYPHLYIIYENLLIFTKFMIFLKRILLLKNGIDEYFTSHGVVLMNVKHAVEINRHEIKRPLEKFVTLLINSLIRMEESVGYECNSFEQIIDISNFLDKIYTFNSLVFKATSINIRKITHKMNSKSKNEFETENPAFLIEEVESDEESFEILE